MLPEPRASAPTVESGLGAPGVRLLGEVVVDFCFCVVRVAELEILGVDFALGANDWNGARPGK